MENAVEAITLPRTEDLVFWVVWLVIVIIFLLRDVVKACMRRAFWFPGQALVLRALIIQLLPFVDYSNISVYSGSSYEKKEVSASLVINQLVIDNGRLMMYVLIAYLIPGMARSGSTSDAIPLAVLASIIISHLKEEKRSGSTILIFAMFIYLLWLLMRAFMVGRSIRRIMSQKIRSALSCRPPGHVHPTEYHVHKCWIVARLSQPDYVMARSGFCSMVCRIVTAWIVLHVIKWTHVHFTDNESLNSVTQRKLVLFVIVIQYVIVVIGWIVLICRGWFSVLHRDISSGDYLNSVSIEDALTLCNDKRNQEQIFFQLFPVRLVQKFCQLFTWPWVQKLVQFLTPGFVPIATDNDADFEMYQPILKKLQIGGESEQNLWKANQQGFNRVKRKMEQGRQADVDRRRVLTGLLHRVMEQARQADVARRSVLTGESVERVKELQQANKNSWKRTAVSLIYLMMYENGRDLDIREAMTGYTEAWEYMHFVDGLNVEVKSLGWKTDEEFDRLYDTWNKPGMLQSEIRDPLDRLRNFSDEERDDLQNSRDSANVAKYCLLQTSLHDRRERGQLRRELANVYLFCMTEDLNKAILEKCCKLAEEGREEEILDVAFLAAKAQAVWQEAGVEPRGPEDLPERPEEFEGPLERPEDPPERPEHPLGRPEGPTGQASSSSHSPTAGVGPGGPTGQASTNIPTVEEGISRPKDDEAEFAAVGTDDSIGLRRRKEIPPAGKGKGQAELPSIELIQSSDAAAGTGDGIRSRRPTETAAVGERPPIWPRPRPRPPNKADEDFDEGKER